MNRVTNVPQEDKNIQKYKRVLLRGNLCAASAVYREDTADMPIKIKIIQQKGHKVDVRVKRPSWQQFIHY